jgi:hypothetical protein
MGKSWISERIGLAAKCCFHSRGVNSAAPVGIDRHVRIGEKEFEDAT